MPFGRKSSRFSRRRSSSFLGKTNLSGILKSKAKTPRSKKVKARTAISEKPLHSFDFKLGKKRFSVPFYSPRQVLHGIKDLFTTKEGLKKLLFITLIFVAIIAALFVYYAKDLPSPDKINAEMTAQSTQIFDRNGVLLYEIHGEENRILADYNDIPEYLKEATVAIEDKDFYKHGGFSVTGILRAMYGVVTGNTEEGGGSTITQQYVKNTLLTSEYSFVRKFKEIILAIEIEQRYSKEDILKMYLNEIFYGSNAYGVEVAAKTFFNKDLSELTLEECALLAALPQSPTYYSPYGSHLDDLLSRKNKVLNQMAAQGYITTEEADAAKAKEIVFSNNPYGSITAPHFVMYVQEQLVEEFGETVVNTGGLKVYTTLNAEYQEIAENAVTTKVDANAGRYNASNAGLVAMDPKTGQILAMVGSKDYFDDSIDGQVNVTLSKRQPGSSFKPFAYAALFMKDSWGAGSTVYDVLTNFGNYTPQNYTGQFWGPVSIRSALQNSLNIPAVKTLYLAGLENVISLAESMGISTLGDSSQYGLSLVLGSGEVKLVDMTSAYGVFANGGVKQDTAWMMKIEDSEGNIIDQYKETSGKRVLDEQIAYIISNILSDDNARSGVFGTGGVLTISGHTVAAKTGTTNSYKDAWTIGYTPSIVTGVWAGNNDGTPMTSAGGAIAAAPIWNAFMKAVLAGTENEQFTKPSGIKTVTVTTGTKTTTDIYPSWYNVDNAVGSSKEVRIYTPDGLLAADSCPAELVETKTFASIVPEIPTTDSNYDNWYAPIAAWAASQGILSTSAMPTQTTTLCDGSDAPTVSIVTPTGNGNLSAEFDVIVDMTATAGVQSFTVTLDGTAAIAELQDDGTYKVSFSDVAVGTHELIATIKDNKYQTATDSVTVTVK